MARIELKVGTVELAIDGEEKWVAQQFEATSAKIAEFAKVAPKSKVLEKEEDVGDGLGPVSTLATHLKERGADKSSNRKFLATADWLRRKGEKSLTTGKVTTSLKDNQQKRLGNASQCLNSNVSQGFCEKDGTGFYVTQEGLIELGYTV